jgi:hypothetical protein
MNIEEIKKIAAEHEGLLNIKQLLCQARTEVSADDTDSKLVRALDILTRSIRTIVDQSFVKITDDDLLLEIKEMISFCINKEIAKLDRKLAEIEAKCNSNGG